MFFRKLGDDRFEATQWTRGPWSPVDEHAGPPSALLAGRLEEMAGESFRVARVAIEVTRPVPIGTLRLERSFRREGRSVKVMAGHLFDQDRKLVMSAEALALGIVELDLETERPPMDEPSPADSAVVQFPFQDSDPGYAAAMELRFGRGGFGDGDVMAWADADAVARRHGAVASRARPRRCGQRQWGEPTSEPFRVYVREPGSDRDATHPAEGDWVGLAART